MQFCAQCGLIGVAASTMGGKAIAPAVNNIKNTGRVFLMSPLLHKFQPIDTRTAPLFGNKWSDFMPVLSMSNPTTSYRVLSRVEHRKESNFLQVQEIGTKVLRILNQPSIQAAIKDENQLGASSARVQEIMLADLERLGFTSEKKGLFSEYQVPGIRPDYFNL